MQYLCIQKTLTYINASDYLPSAKQPFHDRLLAPLPTESRRMPVPGIRKQSSPIRRGLPPKNPPLSRFRVVGCAHDVLFRTSPSATFLRDAASCRCKNCVAMPGRALYPIFVSTAFVLAKRCLGSRILYILYMCTPTKSPSFCKQVLKQQQIFNFFHEKFWRNRKKSYLCIRFRERTKPQANRDS